MKILITGALGHIGSRFIHTIKPGDYNEVVLVDNLFTQRYCSLFKLPADVPFKFIEADICNADLNSLLKDIDVVLHLAAITDAANSHNNPELTEIVNYGGTLRIAQACCVSGSRLIFLSTTSVYGTQEKLVDENCTGKDLSPQSPYAESKLKAESMIQQLGSTSNLRFIICRFGTIFGTSIGMRFHTAVNKFCWQASLGEPISIWKTAYNQKRPYLDLSDAVRALDFIIKNDFFNNGINNVLTCNTTVGEIVETILKYIPETKIEYVDSRIMNQLSYEVLCEKFKASGFVFNGNIADGIRQTIDYLKGIHQYKL
jgi:UDP-glucose 4-epimerase